jgi:hypothetical protein
MRIVSKWVAERRDVFVGGRSDRITHTSESRTACSTRAFQGALNWKSRFVERLDDDAIEVLTDSFARCPSPMMAVVLDHWHGAATTRVASDATVFPHRHPG